MANLIKTVLTFDDGSTQEFDAAPVILPTQIVDVKSGESVEVVDTDVPVTPAEPASSV